MAIRVDVDNFARAETDRMFAGLQAQAGGINRFHHNRVPAPVDHQPVIRMNRDTLYSMALVDLASAATLTVPDAGRRYLSVMVVNQDHYINRVFHGAGTYPLTQEGFDTRYVVVLGRTLMDPADQADVAAANAVQDGLALTAASADPFAMPDYDEATQTQVRDALLELGRTMTSVEHAFGRKEDVDPIRHLVGTAVGWGGLPDAEAKYANVDPGLPVGEYRIRVTDVPVDAFWSISVYNAAGFFEPNDRDAYSVNSITGVRDADGAITVHLGGDGSPNCIPIAEGWNYIVRLYRPRPEILNGTWTFPVAERIG